MKSMPSSLSALSSTSPVPIPPSASCLLNHPRIFSMIIQIYQPLPQTPQSTNGATALLEQNKPNVVAIETSPPAAYAYFSCFSLHTPELHFLRPGTVRPRTQCYALHAAHRRPYASRVACLRNKVPLLLSAMPPCHWSQLQLDCNAMSC